jgi:hypothetical protein
MTVDLREFGRGDRVTVETDDGETWTGLLSGYEQSPPDAYGKGYVSATFEGEGFWDRLKDRVDSEVLNLRQDYSRDDGRPQEATVGGHVWVGEVEEASVIEYRELSTVVSVEKPSE